MSDLDSDRSTPRSVTELIKPFQEEFNEFMLGKLLGEGCYRAVFVAPWDEKYVIKLERDVYSREFCNVNEWRIWNAAKGTEAEKWFAPCRWISRNGNVLVQRRTKPIKKSPAMIPAFMSDGHVGNWGRIGNKIVCHDYGFSRIDEHGLKRMKLIKNPYHYTDKPK